MAGLTLRNVDRTSPWSSLGAWTREFDHLFDEMQSMISPLRTGRDVNIVNADCDIQENESSYMLTMDLPGIAKDDIEITCSGDTITVNAERKNENLVKDAKVHRTERYYGQIKRVFRLPEGVEGDKIQANYENGVLYLSLPKAEVAKPKKIEIGSGKGGFLRNLANKALDVKGSKTVNS